MEQWKRGGGVGRRRAGERDGQGLAAEGISYVQYRRPVSPSPSFSTVNA